MSRELTWYEKTFVKMMRTVAARTEGYVVTFDEEIIRQQGLSGFFKWAKATQQTYADLEKGFGSESAHLLACFASFFNGCDYCAWGHLYAANLLQFERTGTLYPIDEQEVTSLMKMGDSVVLAELERRLSPTHATHLRLVQRQYQLRNGELPVSDEDKLIVRSIALYDWVNECSIVVNAPAPPLDRVAKKQSVIDAYIVARAPGRALLSQK